MSAEAGMNPRETYYYTDNVTYNRHDGPLKEDHVKQSRAFIMEGAGNFKGRVVIFAPSRLEPFKMLIKQFAGEVICVGVEPSFLTDCGKQFAKKVTWITADLTGGFLKEIDTMIREIEDGRKLLAAQEKDAVKLMKAAGYRDADIRAGKEFGIRMVLEGKLNTLAQKCKTFQPNLDALIKQIGAADYIISSGVASMLSSNVNRFLRSYFKTNGLDVDEHEARHSLHSLDSIFQVFHMRFLHTLAAKKDGTVCFIDTPQAIMTGNKPIAMLEPALWTTMSNLFVAAKEGQWQLSGENLCLNVKACVLRIKPVESQPAAAGQPSIAGAAAGAGVAAAAAAGQPAAAAASGQPAGASAAGVAAPKEVSTNITPEMAYVLSKFAQYLQDNMGLMSGVNSSKAAGKDKD